MDDFYNCLDVHLWSFVVGKRIAVCYASRGGAIQGTGVAFTHRKPMLALRT